MAKHHHWDSTDVVPTAPIDRLRPLTRFLQVESAGGIVLFLVTLVALWLANSQYADDYLAFWRTKVGFMVGAFEMRHSLRHWINDGLMTVFFFVMGMEVKREIAIGELRQIRSAALPVAAALGGMVMPAALYLALQWNGDAPHGWGIPMATDIAFVVGCLAILGSSVPRGLRVMLVSLAIADDIGAICVIAFGYSSGLNLEALGWGMAGIAMMMLLVRLGVRNAGVFLIFGLGIWFAFHESGVHATVAGVILGLLTPVKPWVSEERFTRFVSQVLDALDGDVLHDVERRHAATLATESVSRDATSPLERWELALHPWVNFLIMPVFALANAGVAIKVDAFRHPVAIAVMIGLVVGKPLGILLFSWVAVKLGLATLPSRVNWKTVGAGGMLAGIGFTMSLFIAGLALDGTFLNEAKTGILAASGLAAVIGTGLLWWLSPVRRGDDASSEVAPGGLSHH